MRVHNPQTNKKLVTDLLNSLKELRSKRGFDTHTYIEAKCILLNKYMRDFNLKSCVVGVSGGIDSAITLGLVHKAAKFKNSPIKKIFPILLPVFSPDGATNQQETIIRGEEVAKTFNIKPVKIDLTQSHRSIKNAVDENIGEKGKGWASGQLVSYVRTPALYYVTSLLAQKNIPGVICGTTNKDEGAYLGYFGKASDGMVDLQLISDIHKSEVYKVAKSLGVPKSVLEVTPSGDMFDGRVDEDVFGTPYDFVELYMLYLSIKDEREKEKLFKSWDSKAKKQFTTLKKRLERMHNYNKHKYLGKSPAVHLDVYESSIPDGWNNAITENSNANSNNNFVGEFSLSKELIDVLHQNKNLIKIKPIKKIGDESCIIDNLLTKKEIRYLLDDLANQKWIPVGKDGMKKNFNPETDAVGSYRASCYSEKLAKILWERVVGKISTLRVMKDDTPTDWNGERVWRAVGINPLMRFIRYDSSGVLVPHYDGPYAYNPGKRTLMSLVLYLTDNNKSTGGATRFIKDKQKNKPLSERKYDDWERLAINKEVVLKIYPRKGTALLFDHRILHDSESLNGKKDKILLRTDIIFERCGINFQKK